MGENELIKGSGKNLFPEKYCILSGSALKLIAVITMIIDHTGAYLIRKTGVLVYNIGPITADMYTITRFIGRIAFPIFCFLIVEGFLHTHDRKKYGFNLLVFAIISDIPWDLVHSLKWFSLSSQNVYFTLLLGYAGLCVIEKYKGGKQIAALLALLITSVVIKCDYGCSGFGMIMLIYLLRENRLLQAVVGSCVLSSRWKAGLAFIPINLYNGKRGFIHGKVWKYIFYLIYPAQLVMFYVLRRRLLGW